MNMPPLPYLPNEIIRTIISFLLPQDIDNFTITCKLYHGLLRDVREEHLDRKKRYYEVDDKHPMTIPFLVAHPELTWYIRRLIIQKERFSPEDWDRIEGTGVNSQLAFGDVALQHALDFMDIIRRSLRNSGLVSPTEESAWLESVKEGVDAPLKLLLLALAPNINFLVLHPGLTIMSNSPKKSFLYLFGQAIDRAALMPVEVRPRICPALVDVRVVPPRTAAQPYNYFIALRSYEIIPFFYLPALSRLSVETYLLSSQAHGIAREDDGNDLRPGPQQFSIQSLYFEGLNADTCDDLIPFIKGTKTLKSFHIHRPERSFGTYLQALSQSHAGTLEELDLGDYNTSTKHIGSLGHFRALKSLSLELGLLVPIPTTGKEEGGRSEWKLDRVLPSSLERLQVLGHHIRSSQGLIDGCLGALAAFVECKATTHPHLRTIRPAIRRLDCVGHPGLHRLQSACQLHNVLLEGWSGIHNDGHAHGH